MPEATRSAESPVGEMELPALLTLALIRRHYFPVGERTVFRLISSGRFPKADVQIGGKLRLWKRETIEAWISATAKRSQRV